MRDAPNESNNTTVFNGAAGPATTIDPIRRSFGY
jgi:hypothetical protein